MQYSEKSKPRLMEAGPREKKGTGRTEGASGSGEEEHDWRAKASSTSLQRA